MNPWHYHPTGIRSRALPDGWPPIDRTQGFIPPFAVDLWDAGSSETLTVWPTITEAAQFASWLHRRAWRGQRVEITDQNGRTV